MSASVILYSVIIGLFVVSFAFDSGELILILVGIGFVTAIIKGFFAVSFAHTYFVVMFTPALIWGVYEVSKEFKRQSTLMKAQKRAELLKADQEAIAFIQQQEQTLENKINDL